MSGIIAFLLASGIVISPVPPSDPSVPTIQLGRGGVYISLYVLEPPPPPPLLKN